MTKSQRITLMAEWWPAACKAQGWDEGDRDKRLEILSEAVGRPLESANDLNNTDDIDKVKAHLGMLADNLAATKETLPGGYWEGEARRLRTVIRMQMRCLAIYPLENGEPCDPEAYVNTIISNKKDKWHYSWTPTLDDLNAEPIRFFSQTEKKHKTIPSQLEQILIIVSRAVQSKRTKAGHSLHNMKVLAGVQCDCKACRQAAPEPLQYSKANAPF